MLPREARFPRRIAFIALRRLAVLTSALLLAATVVGCGDGGTEPDEPIESGDILLIVTVDPDGPNASGEPQTAEVDCDEETAPDCEAAASLDASDFDAVPSDQACTELFGGPDVATLKGSIEGVEIDTELTRANGCEIERFDAAVPLLRVLFPDYKPGGEIEPPGAAG